MKPRDLAIPLPKALSLRYRNVWVMYLSFYLAIKAAFIGSGYDLFTEEAQYWLWSRYPDWSYYSKPPLIAWVNYLTGLIAHDDRIIRLTALAFGMGTLLMLYKVAMLLFRDARIAYLSAFFLSVSPFFMLASTFFTTDSLLIFFWVATAYYFIKAVLHNTTADWMRAGFLFGLGCLSKYSMVFFLLAFLPLVMRGPSVYVKNFLVFLFVAAMMFSPVLYWNSQHGWVTFRHVMGLALNGSGDFSFRKSLLFAGEFLGGLMLITSPFLLYLFYRFRGIFRAVSPREISTKQKILWLLVPVVGTVAFFLVMSMFKRTEVNWGAMSYVSLPVVLAFLTVRSDEYLSAISAAGITLLLLVLLLFPRVWDSMGYSGVVPLRLDSMKRLAGWQPLAMQVSAVQSQYSAAPIIITDSYHVASELSFYGIQEEVYCLNLGRRMNQLDLWRRRTSFQYTASRAVYATELPELPDGIDYETVEARLTFPVIYRGHEIRRFSIFVLRNFRLGRDDRFDAY